MASVQSQSSFLWRAVFLLCGQGLEFSGYQENGYHKGNKVCDGTCQKHAEDAETKREQNDQRDQKEDLPRQREQQTFEGFSDGSKKVGGEQLDAVDQDHEKKGPHK